MAEPGSALELLVQRLSAADPETRKFIQGEIAAHTQHERAMDLHEMRQRYITQAIAFVLPGFGLVISLIAVLNDQEAAAAIIGGLDIVGVLAAMWSGIRRNPSI